MSDLNVVMMGLGYIGLPTSVLMASKGINVLGIDINKNVVDIINRGEIHIVEPDLAGLVKSVVDSRKLKAGTTVAKADVFMIAVPTPFKGSNHEPDLSYVFSATEMVIPYLEPGNLVLLESTSPVGTTEEMAKIIFKKRPELSGKLYVAYCPERVLPGRILFELENNDRSIGGINDESTDKAVWFYSHFVKGKLNKTNARTAEMCKLVENSYRDVNIAFANELSIICDKAKIDVWELIRLANKHPRVNILNPGAGVGGHCIAVDPWFIVHDFSEEVDVIESARNVNDHKAVWTVKKVMDTVKDFVNKNGSSPKVACMGLSYKQDIDDLRESPGVEIAEALFEKLGSSLIVVEPNITEHHKLPLANYEDAVKKADIIVILVPHKEFKNLNIEKNKIIMDICGVTRS